MKTITTAFEYDNTNGSKGYATGQLLKAKLPNLDGVPDDTYSRSLSYDILSRKITEKDQMNLVTTYIYDTEDRVQQINYADGTNVHYDYDTNSNLVTITDAKGVKTGNVYDYRDRLTDVYSALGTSDESHVNCAYDNVNNKIQMKVYDAQAGTIQTDYTCDVLNRLITTTDHPNSNGVANRANSYYYDTAGRKISVVDAKGQKTEFVYDDLDRVTNETTKLVSTGATLGTTGYTYDLVGNRLSMQTDQDVSATTYTYDNLYRLVTQTVPTTVGSGALTTTYTYDLGGNRVLMQAGPSGQFMSTAYKYYGNNWLHKEEYASSSTSTTTLTTEYFYDTAGKKKTVKYPNNTETDYDYCHEVTPPVQSLQNHRLKKLTNRKSSNQEVISFFDYAYDEVGNRRTMNELRGLNTYTYDDLYRLKEVTYPDTRNVKYFYDKAGNRTSMSETEKTGSTPITTLYSYDLANQMLTSTKAGVQTSYLWDLNGNQTTKTTGSTAMTCAWNGKDEMTGITYSGNKPANSMIYNGDGKRVQYVSSEGTQNYVYDGNGTILETDSTGAITKKYNSGISMEKYNKNTDGTTSTVVEKYFYLYDGLGSVVNLTDEKGEIVQVYYYDAFGKSTNVKHDPTNKKQFTGKENDEDSGLQYFLARYYDPEVGRFISNDPIPHLNDYIYCDDDPINLIDYDGQNYAKVGFTMDNYNTPNTDSGDVQPKVGCVTIRIKKEVIQNVVDKTRKTGMKIPKGVDVNKNMEEARKHRGNLSWFYNQVKNKGPWDYKQRGSEYEDFGNFNYGATGAAAGIPDQILLRAAGWAQQL